MIGKRIPHQIVLALACSIIAIGLAAVVVSDTTTAVRQADRTIGYANAELEGVLYLARAHKVFRELLDYRADLVSARIRPRNEPRPMAFSGDVHGDRVAAITQSLATFRDRAPANTPIDDVFDGQLAELRRRWSSTAAQSNVTPQNVSAVIATIQPLLVGISGASGLSNDPSPDGQNFADAILRIPLALTYGSAAASTAVANIAVGDATLEPRFTTAELLAQAQTAINVAVQDAEDEKSVDLQTAAPLAGQAATNARDFQTLKQRVLKRYVAADDRLRRPMPDRVLMDELDTFTVSGLAFVDLLRDDLFGAMNARIELARRQQRRLLAGMVGGLSLEALTMLTLAWIGGVSYKNERKRMAAERAALESQRTELEGQLARAKGEQALLRAKAQFRAVFDRAPTGMIIVDRKCEILDTNEAAQAMLQAGDARISALTIITDHAMVIEHIIDGASDLCSEECEYVDSEHSSRWFHVSISPVHDELGTALFAILMLRDVTASKSLEAQLVFDAGHDSLTGLPNRVYFLAALQKALDERDGNGAGGVFSVVFIDFNDFKTINDSFGHQAGDQFLIDGAARLRNSVRSTDIVARIGGDEFAVVLHGADRAEIERSVTRLQSVVSVPVNIEGQLVASSASFGIARAESSYTLAAEIIRDADTAMYQAKAEGGRNYVVFDVSMREKVVRRMQLSIDIAHALAHDEMQLFFQPIIDLQDGVIAGCEALLRWRRADGTVISPLEFLPLAEENGSITEIGHWVTRTACQQMHAWNELRAQGRVPGLRADFVVHVNLAVPEVYHVDLLSNLRRTLAETKVGRDQIILEITEGIVLKTTPHTRSTLDALTADGFRLCIDDFGTGYSSLRYVNELPLHSLKIDRSFVSNGSDDLANRSIVEMLLVLSRSLGLEVVAEGIETPRQWEMLRDLGCRYGQGYFFAPALSGTRVTEMLQAGVRWSLTPALA